MVLKKFFSTLKSSFSQEKKRTSASVEIEETEVQEAPKTKGRKTAPLTTKSSVALVKQPIAKPLRPSSDEARPTRGRKRGHNDLFVDTDTPPESPAAKKGRAGPRKNPEGTTSVSAPSSPALPSTTTRARRASKRSASPPQDHSLQTKARGALKLDAEEPIPAKEESPEAMAAAAVANFVIPRPTRGRAKDQGGEGPTSSSEVDVVPFINTYPPVGYTHPSVALRRINRVMGHGLFAETDIPAGTVVCSWSGVLVHRNEVENLSANAKRYLIRLRSSDYFINGEPLVDAVKYGLRSLDSVGIGFMINSSGEPNCKDVYMSINNYFVRVLNKPHMRIPLELASTMIPIVCLKTTRDIEKGEELLWNYPVR